MTVARLWDVEGRTSVGATDVARALARLEAARHLRNPVLWLGVVASVYSAWQSASIDWTAGPYSAFPVDFVPAAWAMFVLGAVSGGRDHLAGVRPSPIAAAPSGPERVAAGRLLAIAAPLAIVATTVVAVVVVVRSGGGYTIGEASWSTDRAQLTVAEIAQPILLAAACGAAGVAVGTAVRHAFVAVAAGTLVLFTFGLIAWAWQWAPAVYVAPVQQQPFSVDLPDGGLADVPSDWWLSSPGEHQADWQRLVVDPIVGSGHDLVLIGAGLAFAGWAVRRTIGRVLAVTGVVVATAGVVVQVVAAPW